MKSYILQFKSFDGNELRGTINVQMGEGDKYPSSRYSFEGKPYLLVHTSKKTDPVIGTEYYATYVEILAESEGDWVEDFIHENGLYYNICLVCRKTFKGHKRRSYCKVCKPEAPTLKDGEMVDIYNTKQNLKMCGVKKLSPEVILDKAFLQAGYGYVQEEEQVGTCTFYSLYEWVIV